MWFVFPVVSLTSGVHPPPFHTGSPCYTPLTPSDTRSNGDLPYYGPENNICRQHAKLIVGAGCPDCYREWTMAEEEESKQPDSGPV